MIVDRLETIQIKDKQEHDLVTASRCGDHFWYALTERHLVENSSHSVMGCQQLPDQKLADSKSQCKAVAPALFRA
nr:hypothetical protein [Agrobacterium deltaense]